MKILKNYGSFLVNSVLHQRNLRSLRKAILNCMKEIGHSFSYLSLLLNNNHMYCNIPVVINIALSKAAIIWNTVYFIKFKIQKNPLRINFKKYNCVRVTNCNHTFTAITFNISTLKNLKTNNYVHYLKKNKLLEYT